MGRPLQANNLPLVFLCIITKNKKPTYLCQWDFCFLQKQKQKKTNSSWDLLFCFSRSPRGTANGIRSPWTGVATQGSRQLQNCQLLGVAWVVKKALKGGLNGWSWPLTEESGKKLGKLGFFYDYFLGTVGWYVQGIETFIKLLQMLFSFI